MLGVGWTKTVGYPCLSCQPPPFCQQVTCMLSNGLVAILVCLALSADGSEKQVVPSFEREIAPLIADRCLSCHSGTETKGRLDLSRRSAALRGGESDEPGIVAGKPDDSAIWTRVESDEMPPKHPLTADEKALLRRWIETGAAWPDSRESGEAIDPFRYSTSRRAGYDWWAISAVVQKPLPSGPEPHPIDRFVGEVLRRQSLPTNPVADRRTLARRLFYTLIGMPPSPEEMATFLADDAPEAYERLVDRLLASPHYGERWARPWLDVIRFGETDGFERNTVRPNAWVYRDWVIRALNRDMPYDEFARAQIAGDLLSPADPEMVIATGALVAGVHNTVLGNDEMRAVARQDELEEIIAVTSQAFLGLTAHCGRCHDHKFDPISMQDYYALAAALSDVNHGERRIHRPEFDQPHAEVSKALSTAQARLAEIETPAIRAVLASRPARPEDSSNANPKPQAAVPPLPVAAWDFRTGLEDLLGDSDIKLLGGAKQSEVGLLLDGKTAHGKSEPLPYELTAKTFVVWATLSDLNQRGGGLMTVQSTQGSRFDSIVYGEREPQQWMAGSDFFKRTRSAEGPQETEATMRPVQIAITWSSAGRIALFRDGRPYGKAYDTMSDRFLANESVLLFGLRLEPAGGNHVFAGTIHSARLYDRDLTVDEIAAVFEQGPSFVTSAEIDGRLAESERAERKDLRARIQHLTARRTEIRAQADPLVYAVVSKPSAPTRLLYRGDVKQPRAEVVPGGLSALPGGGPFSPGGLPPRAALAAWMTAPDNPLFARVMANRIWAQHFGVGLVDTPGDFGFNGGRPTHPELLDWLAREFARPSNPQRKPYSIKQLHRLIVTSETWKRSSRIVPEAIAHDADSRQFWRKRPQRLDAEALRDSLLTVSGLLNPEVGGKGFSDYSETFLNGTTYFDPLDSDAPGTQRRSIYRFLPRGASPGLMEVFDCPDSAASAPRRAVTTTPLQALSLWNGNLPLRAAAALARRAESDVARIAPSAPVAEERERQVIARTIQIVFQRAPSDAEIGACREVVVKHGLVTLCRVLLNTNEFVTLE